MAEGTRYIVTFKAKDKRSAKVKDKTEVFRDVVEADFSFLTVEDFSAGRAVPSTADFSTVAYDVNEYAAPIIIAELSKGQAKSLEKDRNVAAVEEDGPIHAYPVIEDQPLVEAETIPWGVSAIKAPMAWDCTKGKAIKVAVLDTGIDGDHPDLAPNFRGGRSFVDSESSTRDYNSHGTHCAGTIAAALNDIGVVGVAPCAYLYAVKVLDKSGSGAWSNLIAGIDWAANKKGMHVLSMSLGASSAPSAVETMCNLAYSKGALLVAAAGNAGGPVGYPAKFDSVMAVSAIDSADNLATFSNRGPEIELAAPGVKVLSTIPGGSYGYKSGTSMACPHVAGAAALAFGSHRYASNDVIRRLLRWRADDLGSPGKDDEFGHGRVDAEQVACEMTPPPADV